MNEAYSSTITVRGGRTAPLIEAMGIMFRALLRSGCTLTKYDYKGDAYSARFGFTVEGDTAAIKAFQLVIAGWVD